MDSNTPKLAKSMKEQGLQYDAGKRMHYRCLSTCHAQSLKQKMLHKGKVVTDPNFKLLETAYKDVKKSVSRDIVLDLKLLTITIPRKPKVTTSQISFEVKKKQVTYSNYCTKCNNKNNGTWELIHA